MDHLRRKTIRPDHVKTIVLDEADEMLNMGFREDIETVLEYLPQEHQTVLFSATMPKPILEITRKYQHDAINIKIVKKELTVANIDQYYYDVKRKDKIDVLTRLLDYYNPKLSLVFCNTKKMVDELAYELCGRGAYIPFDEASDFSLAEGPDRFHRAEERGRADCPWADCFGFVEERTRKADSEPFRLCCSAPSATLWQSAASDSQPSRRIDMIKLKIKYGNSQTDLRFPCTEKEMNAALERIHAEDVTPLELYVSEVVFPEELGCLQDRFVNLDEVNFLGKRMDSFFGDEEYQFYEAMKLEGFDTLPDLINLSFNLNRYPLIQDIGDMGKIGREYLLTVKGCLPADDADDPK